MASTSSSAVSVPLVPLRARPQRTDQLPAFVPQRRPAVAAPVPPLRSGDSGGSLAAMWRKIQGADDWAGLVEPLHPLLRAEVVRYGEFVMACYEAFELDSRSRRYLSCKYGRARLLRETGLGGASYKVTRYVYATPPDGRGGFGRGRWIGYVAVSSDKETRRLGRRDVLVAFRGTVTAAEWAANFMSSLTPAGLDPHDPRPGVEVESGFLSLYTSGDGGACRFGHGSCRQQLLNEVSRLIGKHGEEEMSVSVAGHSMGSALATLFGYDLAELGLNRFRLRREVSVTVYSFGGPRVGNEGFKKRCEELGVKVLRVANVHDPVTKLPGLIMNENWKTQLPWRRSWYVHVGVELTVDAAFKVEDPVWVHDIATYVEVLKDDAGDRKTATMVVQVRKEMWPGLVAQWKMVIKNWTWPDVAAVRRFANLVQCLRLT